jgi:Domain of unknown function (DUF4158)
LQTWLEKQAQQGGLPDELFLRAERYLLTERVVLPGASVLERLITQVCAETHEHLYDALFNQLPTEVKHAIDKLLLPQAGGQRSLFYLLKEYPPSATISSIQTYLERYRLFDETGIDAIQVSLAPAFIDYLNRLTRRYNAKEIKRFNEQKRYALMVCFLLETRKVLLDQLVRMHDQFIMDMLRKAKQRHEKKHREFRKRQKKRLTGCWNQPMSSLIGRMTSLFIRRIFGNALMRRNCWNPLTTSLYLNSWKNADMATYL